MKADNIKKQGKNKSKGCTLIVVMPSLSFKMKMIYLSELFTKGQSRRHTSQPTALNASNFLSYTTQKNSSFLNIGTREKIKLASVAKKKEDGTE